MVLQNVFYSRNLGLIGKSSQDEVDIIGHVLTAFDRNRQTSMIGVKSPEQ